MENITIFFSGLLCTFEEITDPFGRFFRNTGEIVIVINEIKSKSGKVAYPPFKIIKCAPIKVSFHIHSVPATCNYIHSQ